MSCYEKPARPCHSERSEESLAPTSLEGDQQILRSAQNDRPECLFHGMLCQRLATLRNITHTMNRMNKITISWIGIICLTIFLLLVSACSTTITAPAAPTQTSTSAASTTTKENQIAQAVFQAINKSRAANKLTTLKWSNALASSARQHNTAMQAANTLSHQLPGEPDLGARESKQGVNWTWAAENVGETTDQSLNGALTLHTAMVNERPPDNGHRLNILTTTGTMVGVAILLDQQHGKLWLTEDFAKV